MYILYVNSDITPVGISGFTALLLDKHSCSSHRERLVCGVTDSIESP